MAGGDLEPRSSRPLAKGPQTGQRLFANERQQSHEPSPFNGSGDGVLTGGGTATLSATYDPALTIHHFLQ